MICSWCGSFNHLGKAEQLAVAQLVVNGKAVVGTVEQLLARLKRTRCVALLREAGTDRIIAVATLKQPDAAYRRKTFTKAVVPIAGFEAALELGYVVITDDMRGKKLSGDLVSVIVMNITEPTFATTDSNTMRNNLTRSGFIQQGEQWQGKNGMLSLWTINR